MELKRDPNDREIRFNLATAYLHAGDPKRAIEEYERLLESDPNDANILVNLGLAYHNAGEKEKAGSTLRGVIDLASKTKIHSSTLALAHTNLGVVYQADRYLDKAMQEYEKAIEIDPATLLAPRYLKNLRDYIGEGRLVKGPNGRTVMIDQD